MAKDPADRFPDAASLRTELQKVRAVPLTSEPGLARTPQTSQVVGATVRVPKGLKGDGPTAHASAAGRRMPRSAVALAVLATALGLLVVTRNWRSDKPGPSLSRTAPSPSMTPTISPPTAPHGEYEKWAVDFVRRLDRPLPPDATRAAWAAMAVEDLRRLAATSAIRLQDPKDQRRFCVAAMMEIADRGELMFMRKVGSDRPILARDVGDLVGDFVQAGRMAFETIGENDPSILKNPTTHHFLNRCDAVIRGIRSERFDAASFTVVYSVKGIEKSDRERYLKSLSLEMARWRRPMKSWIAAEIDGYEAARAEKWTDACRASATALKRLQAIRVSSSPNDSNVQLDILEVGLRVLLVHRQVSSASTPHEHQAALQTVRELELWSTSDATRNRVFQEAQHWSAHLPRLLAEIHRQAR